MIPRFCTNNSCGTNLKHNTKNDQLTFNCTRCLSEYDSNAEDTLMIDESLREDETIYKRFMYINNAVKDPLAKRVEIKCKNKFCDETQAINIPIDTSGQSINICIKCSHKFL